MNIKYAIPVAFLLFSTACGGSVDGAAAGSSGNSGGGSQGTAGKDGGGALDDGAATIGDKDATAPQPKSFEVKPSELGLAEDRGTTAPVGYQSTIDPTTTIDGESARLLEAPATTSPSDWSATVGVKAIDASYWGKRWRMRVKLKTQNAGGGFAWFRIDQKTGYILDNMLDPTNRSVAGTTPWKEVSLVLDVPKGATQFAFGSGLNGGGKVWIGTVTFEEVGTDIPTTPFAYGGTSP